MPKLRRVSGAQAIRVLERLGFVSVLYKSANVAVMSS
jgi:predicted RNA binding protein YcfA (HicA-like mRNA interferase family)